VGTVPTFLTVKVTVPHGTVGCERRIGISAICTVIVELVGLVHGSTTLIAP
jgi:hypothetical protein